MTDTSITIALSKGRILDETIPLLKEAGIEFVDDIKKSRCVTGLYNFNLALQFSIETMTTVGYGSRALNSCVTRC